MITVHHFLFPPRDPGPPAEGPGRERGEKRPPRGPGEKPQKTLQSPNRLYKAPTDYTKPRKEHTNTVGI